MNCERRKMNSKESAISYISKSFEIYLDNIQTEISEEWLKSFFQKEEMEEGEGHYYSLRLNNSIYCDLTLLGVFENGVWEVVLFPYGKFFRFKYINQVQNIVFELTGKELDNKY